MAELRPAPDDSRSDDAARGGGAERIGEIRARIADAVLVIFAAAVTLSGPISVLRMSEVGWLPSVVAGFAIMVAYWGVALLRARLPYWFKGGFVVATGLVFSASALLSLGIASFGLPVLVLSTVLSVVFFGARGGIVCGAAGLLIVVAAGIGFTTGALRVEVDLDGYVRAGSTWVVAVTGYALLVGVTLASVSRLDRDAGRLIGELGRISGDLERQASEDELTGLPNRRQFMRGAGAEIARVRRYGEPGYLALFDLDHFKRVNDTHGHAAGDEVLRRFARLLAEESRDPDLPARLGGEEFALLMPATGEHGAMTVLERILGRWRESEVEFESGTIRSTVSAGLTELRPDDASVDVTLGRADEALYAAKEAGRDRVVFDP